MISDAPKEIIVDRGDFNRDRAGYIAQASSTQRVIVRDDQTKAIAAVFGGSLNVSPGLNDDND